MSCSQLKTADDLIASFDEHLRRVRGVCLGTRRNYAEYMDQFLVAVFGDGLVNPMEIRAPEVVAFVGGLAGRYRPRTVELAASGLRSFFRFLRAAGLREDRLEDTVPMVPRRDTGLVRHLDSEVFEQLITSLDSSSPRGCETEQSYCSWLGCACVRTRWRNCNWETSIGPTLPCGCAPARPAMARCCR